MLSGQLVERYARALYEVAQEAKIVTDVDKALDNVLQIIGDNKMLADVLYSPAMPIDGKREAVRKIFAGMPEIVMNFLFLLIDKGRETFIIAIAKQYKALMYEEKAVVAIEAITAYPLAAAQRKKLIAKLTKIVNENGEKTKLSVVLNEKIDKTMVGGIVVKIGDRLIDGSVNRQLASMSRRLLAG